MVSVSDNAANPAELAEMLHEMSTVGTTMALLVTAVWGVSMFAAEKIRGSQGPPL